MIKPSTAEKLFTSEALLRDAACGYATNKTNATREALRKAAINYASWAEAIDQRFP